MTRLDLLYRYHDNRRPRGELPASVSAPPVLDRCCAYVDNKHFGERCDEPGTHRLRRDLLARLPNGELRWPAQQHWRWCDSCARPGFHEPIPEES